MRDRSITRPPSQTVAGEVVAAAPYRDLQILRPSEADRRDHVVRPGATGDDRRAPVDHAVPDPARGLVVRVVRKDQIAAQAFPELRDVGCAQASLALGIRRRPWHGHRRLRSVALRMSEAAPFICISSGDHGFTGLPLVSKSNISLGS
jgi:hypothetical protein